MLCAVNSAFVTPTQPPTLARDAIHVWRLHCADASPKAVSDYARAALLQRLHDYAGNQDPIEIARGEHGKPYAVEDRHPRFSISHSGAAILLAFAYGQEVGIDIESRTHTRTRSVLELAQRFFSRQESAALSALPAELQSFAFINLWTGKEAVLKALGRGLAFGLDQVCFELDSQGVPTHLDHVAAEAGAVTDWQLRLLPAMSDHIAALAWHGPPRHVQTYLCPSL